MQVAFAAPGPKTIQKDQPFFSDFSIFFPGVKSLAKAERRCAAGNDSKQFQAAVREYLSISCQVSWTQMMVVSPRYSDKYN
jgi:hypothetical protein